MGVRMVTITVSDMIKLKTGYEALFLVNTGIIDCMVPESELIKADI